MDKIRCRFERKKDALSIHSNLLKILRGECNAKLIFDSYTINVGVSKNLEQSESIESFALRYLELCFIHNHPINVISAIITNNHFDIFYYIDNKSMMTYCDQVLKNFIEFLNKQIKSTPIDLSFSNF